MLGQNSFTAKETNKFYSNKECTFNTVQPISLSREDLHALGLLYFSPLVTYRFNLYKALFSPTF